MATYSTPAWKWQFWPSELSEELESLSDSPAPTQCLMVSISPDLNEDGYILHTGMEVTVLSARAFFIRLGIGIFAVGSRAGYFSQDFDVFTIWIDTVPAWVSNASKVNA